MRWNGKEGFVVGGMMDESSIDGRVIYLKQFQRLGFWGGLTYPLYTPIHRSPGIEAGFLGFPNRWHSRMDPYLHVRLHCGMEEGKYDADRPGNDLLFGRRQAFTTRLQAGYGFHIHLSRQLLLQHQLGVGFALEGYAPFTLLGRPTIGIGFGLGWNLISHLRRDDD